MKNWLDKANDGFIYFTLGSMVRIETFPAKVIESFYKTFRKMDPIKILMKVGNANVTLPGLPSNVITGTWFPQIEILSELCKMKR